MSESDQRGAPRQRALKAATVLLGMEECEISCMVRDVQVVDGQLTGLRLKVAVERAIPSEFLLHLPGDHATYRCELRWRRGDICGIKVLGTATKPDWHYG